MGNILSRISFLAWGVNWEEPIRVPSKPVVYKEVGATISIGRGSVIKSSIRDNLAGIRGPTVLAARTKGALLLIGKNVGISGAVISAVESIHIGDNCNIGVGVLILDSDYHSLNPNMRRGHALSRELSAPVVLEKNVWVGARATILKGTSIGENSVVAAGAVVRGTIPSNVVVAGVPAKVIKGIQNFPSKE